MDGINLKALFDAHGWVIVKNVFSEAEIDRFREKVNQTIKNGVKGDLLSNPLLDQLVHEPRIVKQVKTVLGEEPIYFGDSNIAFNTVSGGFHKDNPDRYDQNAPDWKGPYGVVRAAVYLQDHVKDSGGLLLRDKSQNTTSLTVGKPFNVPVEKGDLVIWTLRTTHSGTALLFKLLPNLIVNPKYYKLIPPFLFRKQKVERIGIFFTYGRAGENLDRYISYLKTRQYAVNIWQHSVYNPAVVAKAESNGLKVMDIRPEVADMKVDTLNEYHKDIPY